MAEMSVGVRELRLHLSRYLAQVKEGTELVVTEHGCPIARVLPAAESKLARLIREGKVRPAREPRTPLPPPLRIEGLNISEFLDEQRR